MEWWQYYSIVCWVIFVVIVLLGASVGLLVLFVRMAAALGGSPLPDRGGPGPEGGGAEPGAPPDRPPVN